MIDSSAVAPAATQALRAFGRQAAARGWVPATSGNFSCRLDDRRIAITRSGRDKGTLGPDDFIAVDLHAALPPGVSAETPLHVARYRAAPATGAILHVHCIAATVLSRLERAVGAVVLDGYEMHKALEGFTTHASVVRLPVFENDQDTAALAEHIEGALASGAGVPGYLLAGHGLYAWGSDVKSAHRHVEALDFLMQCALEERRIR